MLLLCFWHMLPSSSCDLRTTPCISFPKLFDQTGPYLVQFYKLTGLIDTRAQLPSLNLWPHHLLVLDDLESLACDLTGFVISSSFSC